MSFMNILSHINVYEDAGVTSNPSKNNTKWTNDIQGITVQEPTSKSLKLAAGDSIDLFSSSLSINADNTTTYDLSLKSGTANTYILSHNSGTNPDFRTLRVLTYDATTEITITKNAKLMKIQATGGTIFDLVLNGVVVGDEIRLGSAFNAYNRGKFKILSLGVDFVTVENSSASAETVTLGAEYLNELKIYSSSGVQVGNKIDLKAGFSSLSFGTYEITDVADNYLEFYSIESLPEEEGVSNDPDAILIYTEAKKFIYIESDKKLSLKINGSVQTNTIEPILVGGTMKNGIFMNNASIKTMVVENVSRDLATIFYITAE